MRSWTSVPRAIASPRPTWAAWRTRMMIDLRPRLLPALVAGLGVSLLIGAIHLMSSDLPDMPREAGLDTHVSVSLLEVRLLELEREREREIDRQGRRPIRPNDIHACKFRSPVAQDSTAGGPAR
ncbi:MAG: hypothetical protein KBG28_29915 [Kofleriaceae bacterium]|nr:hypothetical protein [Kofleriaceae bacterium]MBP9208223.1 hypothetical protein [Kofleriaceae bacterium]